MFRLRDIGNDELPWPLLLDADPYRPHIAKYAWRATWLGLYEFERPAAVAALLRQDPATIELMNIAVEPARRRHGVGTRLLRAAIARARAMGATRMVLGTGNSTLDALAFYQKEGFRIEAVDRDYFVREYPEPIFENGIACRDMLRLGMALEPAA